MDSVPTYFRETLRIAAGGDFSAMVRAEGSVWATGLGEDYQMGNAENASTKKPVQVGVGNFYTLYIGDSSILNDYDRTDPSKWINYDRLPRYTYLQPDEQLHFNVNDMIQAYISAFNLITEVLEEPVDLGTPADPSLVEVTVSDPTVAHLEKLPNGEWFLHPTGSFPNGKHGDIILSVYNTKNGYRGDYTVSILPRSELDDSNLDYTMLAEPKVVAGDNAAIALQADGTVWYWGKWKQYNSKNEAYDVWEEYPTEGILPGIDDDEYAVDVAVGGNF